MDVGLVLEARVTEASRDEALRRLADRTARRGLAIAHDLLRSRAEAEDAVQEALARACEGYDRLRDPQALEGWFYRVLTNLCMRQLRRRRFVRALRGVFGGGAEPADAEAAPELDLPDGGPAADDALARAGDVRRTLSAMGALPAMQRAAIVLRYGHDLPVGDVAEMLGVGAGTVKTHLVRGLQRLRAELGEDEA